jgi:imidazolonepropionase-like amidohydrolase
MPSGTLVRANARRGVNQIKILATERGGSSGYRPPSAEFSEVEIKSIVNEARKANLRVAAHAPGTKARWRCDPRGVATIEHGSFMSDATLDQMKTARSCLVPTMLWRCTVLATPMMQKAATGFS